MSEELDMAVSLGLRVIAPAFAASALAAGVSARWLGARDVPLGLAAAVGLGLTAGNWLNEPLPYWPEETGWRSLLVVGWIALGVGAALSGFQGSRTASVGIRAAEVLCLAAMLLPAELRTPVWLGGLGLVALADVLCLEASAERQPTPLAPLAWACWAAGGAALILVSHSLRLAEAGLGLAAALAGVGFVAILRPLQVQTLAFATSLYVPALMLAAYDSTFSSVSWVSFALVAGAPLMLALAWIPWLRDLPERARPWRDVLLLAIPVVVALALAIRAEGV